MQSPARSGTNMKLNAQNATFIKIPVEQLYMSENVRKEIDNGDISQLAWSIQKNGLLNPISVRPAVEKDGEKTYEVIAGHRRVLAIQKLCEDGFDFNMVECCIRPSGKMHTLQLIENIQRVDLSAKDKEAAIQQMLDSGMTQGQIAAELSKSINWVSDIVAGINKRQEAESAGIDTSGIGTRAMAQIRSVPQENLQQAVEELKHEGGTVKAATEIQHKYKPVSNKPAKQKAPDKSLQNTIAIQIRDFWKTYQARYRDRVEDMTAFDLYTALLEFFEEGI